MNNKENILNELRKAMGFYRELGFEYVPVKEKDLNSFLSYRAMIPNEGTHKKSDDGADKAGVLSKFKDDICDCSGCGLSKGRKNVVFGEGSADARLMFIGEGPGRDEDIQARPFIGDAGKLLTNLIVKLGLKREDVYIANIVKCRPPNNRNPEKEEIAACIPYVKKQVDIIKPDVIICLGRISANALLGVNAPISGIRGTFSSYMGIPVMPTFHPAYLLRNKKDKWLTWDDMQKVIEKLK